ncbi:MAG TPA: serine hydroxymethyltransferase, partial [Thermoanaerobaculia bacterium]|nr:serine hydroxymethyltransferase [Thermoanaerobaculia bacterium]
ACQLFGAKFANVQPHSGAQANTAAMMAVLSPGDTFASLVLKDGGHLSHGMKINFSGTFYRPVHYPLHYDKSHPEHERIDYDACRKVCLESRPKAILCGYSAYPRVIDFKRFRQIADECGALLMADIAHIAGLIAGGEHPSPFPHAHVVTTTTHKTLRGPRAGLILCTPEWAKEVDKAVFPGQQGGPLEHIIAAKAVALKEAATPEFNAYQRQIVENARVFADAMAANGFRIVSGGTDNHLFLVDVGKKSLTGKVAEKALDAAGITVNKNAIPFDPNPPMVTSGLRIGTPAVTTRGMGTTEMTTIAGWIAEVLAAPEDTAVQARVHAKVRELTAAFPLY